MRFRKGSSHGMHCPSRLTDGGDEEAEMALHPSTQTNDRNGLGNSCSPKLPATDVHIA